MVYANEVQPEARKVSSIASLLLVLPRTGQRLSSATAGGSQGFSEKPLFLGTKSGKSLLGHLLVLEAWTPRIGLHCFYGWRSLRDPFKGKSAGNA